MSSRVSLLPILYSSSNKKKKNQSPDIHNDQERERQWTLYVKKQSNMLANKDRERKKEKKKKARKCVCRSVREREGGGAFSLLS